jgi:hypothetical protein
MTLEDSESALILETLEQAGWIDVVALRLAVQTGSPGPEGRVATFANAISENRS